jgi:hypothetical protein
MRGYWSVTVPVMKATSATARGEDDVAAGLEVGRVHDELRGVLAAVITAMRADLGVSTRRPAVPSSGH